MAKGRKANNIYKRLHDMQVQAKLASSDDLVDREVEVTKLENSSRLDAREGKARLRSANSKLNKAMAIAIEESVDEIIADAKKKTASRLAKQAVEGES